jgi:hypothetical protein
MAPKSLTEGREALEAAKAALKEKEIEVAAEKQLAESKKIEVKPEQKDRAKLKVIAEGIKSQKTAAVEAETSTELTKSNSALDYEVFLG